MEAQRVESRTSSPEVRSFQFLKTAAEIAAIPVGFPGNLLSDSASLICRVGKDDDPRSLVMVRTVCGQLQILVLTACQ